MMRIRVFLPDQILIDSLALKVSVEGLEGAFTLLPNHIDYAAIIVPGLLSYVNRDEEERILAVDSGVLVKNNRDVRVSVRNAVRGTDLGNLRETVTQKFEVLEDREREARAVLASLEADLVRRFINLGRSP